ncbi:MAG: tetratricopeptide repeat protein [Holosporaceae bacterium]|nr:sel1 repeat family protein [Rhodospirillaceae bacterium]
MKTWAQSATAASAVPDTMQVADLITAAKSGDPTAQIALGKRYAYGNGIEKNRELAREWLGKAADRNFGLAMVELGKLLYNDGTNTPADRILAYKWLTLAESKGYSLFSEEAKRLKQQLMAAMTNDEVFEGQKAAQEWLPAINPAVLPPTTTNAPTKPAPSNPIAPTPSK